MSPDAIESLCALFEQEKALTKPKDNRAGCEPTCCRAGIRVIGNRIRACDACRLFETDEDAAAAVVSLLQVLHHLYAEQQETVADAVELLFARCGSEQSQPAAP